MADIEVIYDQAKEMACIVNVESRMGWGPAMIGPEAGQLLQAFVDSVPFDITLFDSHSATEAFAGFLAGLSQAVAATPATSDNGAVGPVADTTVVPTDQAEHEAAVQAESVGHDAPADTDAEAQPATPSQVVSCFNCNGTGQIEFGGDEASQRCNMCQGSGKILQAA